MKRFWKAWKDWVDAKDLRNDFQAALFLAVAGVGGGFIGKCVEESSMEADLALKQAELDLAHEQLRLERMREKRATLEKFANGIPRSKGHLTRIMLQTVWLQAHPSSSWSKDGPPEYWDQRGFAEVARDLDRKTDELLEGDLYPSLCELALIQFKSPDVQEAVWRIRALFDLMTEVSCSTVDKNLSTFDQLTEGGPFDTLPSDDPFALRGEWIQKLQRQRESFPAGSERPSPTSWRAAQRLLRATDRAIDVAFLGAVEGMGREVDRDAKAARSPRKE